MNYFDDYKGAGSMHAKCFKHICNVLYRIGNLMSLKIMRHSCRRPLINTTMEEGKKDYPIAH